MVARGTQAQLLSVFNIALMWWLTLELRIAWRRGCIGKEVEWIGAKIQLEDENLFVKVTVTQTKLEEWRALAKALDAKFTGKMSWASGSFVQLKPFVHTLMLLQTKEVEWSGHSISQTG